MLFYKQAECLFDILFFFFKQKTAYEMRISDWSSDVCSSDLLSRQILYCEIRNGVDDCSKSGWVSIGHTARKAVILGALSRDHISGDRPGTASKTQKAGLCRKSSFHESHGFINRLQLFLA